MRVILGCRTVALGFAIAVAGCAAPPNAEIEAARAAVDRATADRAGQYAAESLKAAQDAQAALDAELRAQENEWFKSYDRSKELALAAKTAGDKAAADAVAGKERADADAAKAKADAAKAKAAMATTAPMRIGGQIKAPTKTKDVTPLYPAIARSARVGGAVIIEATAAYWP